MKKFNNSHLLKAITNAQAQFITNVDTRVLFEEFLSSLLSLTQSEYGFIGEIFHDSANVPYLKSHAITNIAWNEETRAFYERNAAAGLEFRNLNSLFGVVIATGKSVISNSPSTDPRRCGIPTGHPPLNAFLGLPFFSDKKMVGMVGIANRPEGYDEKIVEYLQPFLSTCSSIIVAHRIDKKRKDLESQLLHTQKMEAIGQLAGGIAHDFNNILTSIFFYGDMLLSKRSEDAVVRKHCEQILSLSEKAAKLTSGLLSFSRKQIINHQPMDLNKLIAGVEELLSRLISADIEFKIELSKEALVIMADSGQIEQMLTNLINNAKDAMPQGGRLTISTSPVEFDAVFSEAHGFEPGAYACVTVSDTGTGMDEETKKRIFEPFFTTKEVGKGTGLGLAMVYGIIKQHDGYIDVYSEQGIGTTFKIYLPESKPGVETAKPAGVLTPAKGTETVLVAEDNPDVMRVVRRLLFEFGYDVVEATNGEEAVEEFKENLDRIRLVILDVIMPKRNGKEAYDEIKKIAPNVKVLFTSGYSEDIINNKMIAEQGQYFIPKPIMPAQFLTKIREILDCV